MTIEEKLRLTIYEAEDAGIITESDKDEMISFIEEKRELPLDVKKRNARIRRRRNYDKLDDALDKQLDKLDIEMDKEREKRNRLIQQMKALDPSLHSSPEAKSLMGQLKLSESRYRKLQDEYTQLCLKGNDIDKNRIKQLEQFNDKIKYNKKRSEIAQNANNYYGHKN